ncbi:hypothetical protein AAMO2058_000849000 [Amorphochlora amoebiformis]
MKASLDVILTVAFLLAHFRVHTILSSLSRRGSDYSRLFHFPREKRPPLCHRSSLRVRGGSTGKMSFVAPGEAASLKLMADAYDNDHKLKMMQSKPIALICMVMGTDLAEISSAIAAYARIWIQWSLSKKKKSEERQWSNFRFPFPQEVNGSVLDQSPVYNLSAKHYVKEFGEVLYKRAYLVSVPIDPANYVGLKLAALATERKFSYPVETENQHVRMYRKVNLDPGILSVGSLYVVSTKYAGHRLCIAPGLWAEICLHYQNGSYKPMPWTYPDFRQDEVLNFLKAVRQRHLLGHG